MRCVGVSVGGWAGGKGGLVWGRVGAELARIRRSPYRRRDVDAACALRCQDDVTCVLERLALIDQLESIHSLDARAIDSDLLRSHPSKVAGADLTVSAAVSHAIVAC
jgi:hypothetical protein